MIRDGLRLFCVFAYLSLLSACNSGPAPNTDFDNDGVVDSNDLCPNTLGGTQVDSKGCDIDTDGDGVLNQQDKCKTTELGARVGADGCAIEDQDNDGVLDARDKCTNTDPGLEVGADGCAIEDYPSGASKCILNESKSDCLVDLPNIPWPFPKASKIKKFEDIEIGGLNSRTFASLTNDLELILKSVQYENFSYYNIPTGIAMVTEIERIQPDGTPFDEEQRWIYGDLSLSIQSAGWLEIFKRFVGAATGNYRVFVFTITDKNVVIKTSSTEPKTEFVTNLPESGGNNLPQIIGKIPFKNNFNLSLFVYEIEWNQADGFGRFVRSNLKVKQHLQQTGIEIK